MPKVQSHRDLIVWNKAMDLAVEVYRLTSSFPTSERYRLVDQLSRAAASVPANIAEGQARSTAKDFAHFPSIARGSLMETQTYLMLAVRLDYLTDTEAAAALDLITEISRMLTALQKSLRAQQWRQRTVCRPLSTVSCALSPINQIVNEAA